MKSSGSFSISVLSSSITGSKGAAAPCCPVCVPSAARASSSACRSAFSHAPVLRRRRRDRGFRRGQWRCQDDRQEARSVPVRLHRRILWWFWRPGARVRSVNAKRTGSPVLCCTTPVRESSGALCRDGGLRPATNQVRACAPGPPSGALWMRMSSGRSVVRCTSRCGIGDADPGGA